MTPQERQFASGRLREIAAQIRVQLARDDGIYGDRDLLLKTAASLAVLADTLAVVIEDVPPEASRR